MKLLAAYTAEDRPSIILMDVETKEIIHTIEPVPDPRSSLTWRANNWCLRNGHEIVDWDRSRLTNGEADDDLPRI